MALRPCLLQIHMSVDRPDYHTLHSWICWAHAFQNGLKTLVASKQVTKGKNTPCHGDKNFEVFQPNIQNMWMSHFFIKYTHCSFPVSTKGQWHSKYLCPSAVRCLYIQCKYISQGHFWETQQTLLSLPSWVSKQLSTRKRAQKYMADYLGPGKSCRIGSRLIICLENKAFSFQACTFTQYVPVAWGNSPFLKSEYPVHSQTSHKPPVASRL